MRGNCSLKMSISQNLFLYEEPKIKNKCKINKNDAISNFSCFKEKVALAEKN